MLRTRIQRGAVNLDISSSGKQIWVFRWRETRPDGRRTVRKKVIGSAEKYPNKKAAENAARLFRLNLIDQGSAAFANITMEELVRHFQEHELCDSKEAVRAYSTKDRFQSVLNRWILPRWGKTAIDQIRTVAAEEPAGFESPALAPDTIAKKRRDSGNQTTGTRITQQLLEQHRRPFPQLGVNSEIPTTANRVAQI